MRNRILHLLALFVLGIITAACVRGEEPSSTPEANFQSLWKAIDEHYCFLDYKKEAIGVDWDEVYTRYHARINPKMTSLQLFEVLCDMLSELQDGHVNLYCSADIGRNWSWYEDHPKNLDEEVRDAYLGTDYHIASSLKYRILSDNIGYILYESFGSSFGDGNLDDCLYYLRACNGLIIDVRGNSGGDLTNAERLSSRFTNERILVGYMSHKTGPGRHAFSTPVAEYLDSSPHYRWQKPCVVLTNRHCYSATNTFVRNMRECPNVTVMGDQTGGGSGLPFTSELPNGWMVRFSACPMYDALMQQIEFGIQPDTLVALDSADVARGIDTIIEAAREKLKTSQ